MRIFAQFAMVSLCAALLPAATAKALPILDGDILASDGYQFTLTDRIGEPGLSGSSLDIASLKYAKDATWLYFGLKVAGQSIEQYGGDDTISGYTTYWLRFQDNSSTSSQKYMFKVDMGDMPAVSFMTRNAANTKWLNTPLTEGVDYDFAIDSGLEFKIRRGSVQKMNTNKFYVTGQLDDNGTAADDQIAGVIPEPGTVALLGLGAAALLARKRRQRAARK